jgi:hypothetical protein
MEALSHHPWLFPPSTSVHGLIFVILIKPDIMFAPINYNMHKAGINEVININ